MEALEEVGNLEEANPSPTGAAPKRPEITRVIGRASVVLLSSHFERYVRRVNEEVATYLTRQGIAGERLPLQLRLLHSSAAIDEVSAVDWLNREAKLKAFIDTDVWLWQKETPGTLQPGRLLAWMKAPTPKNLIRYYRYWGIEDIFSALTRMPHTRNDLWLRLQSLVDKRNNIAHGDHHEHATPRDVRSYTAAVRTFCDRADRKLARQIRNQFAIPNPW